MAQKANGPATGATVRRAKDDGGLDSRQPLPDKSQAGNNDPFSRIVLRRCADSDEWIALLPTLRGDLVLVIATTAELFSYRRLWRVVADQENHVLFYTSERRWRDFIQSRGIFPKWARENQARLARTAHGELKVVKP